VVKEKIRQVHRKIAPVYSHSESSCAMAYAASELIAPCHALVVVFSVVLLVCGAVVLVCLIVERYA
jgi:hypothetical protein